MLLTLTLTLTLNLTLTRRVPRGGSHSLSYLAVRRGGSRGRRAGLCIRSARSNWEVRVRVRVGARVRVEARVGVRARVRVIGLGVRA